MERPQLAAAGSSAQHAAEAKKERNEIGGGRGRKYWWKQETEGMEAVLAMLEEYHCALGYMNARQLELNGSYPKVNESHMITCRK